MYNEQFQYGQRISTSGYGSESLAKPSPFRLDPPKPSIDQLGSGSPNPIIIQKI